MSYRLGVLVAVAFLLNMVLGGCSHSNNAHYTQANIDQVRADFQKQDPDARVGVVTGVVGSSNIASVGQVVVHDFHRDDVITFIDSHGRILTTGRVEGANEGGLLVQYSPPADGQRAPDIGDLAVRAIK